MNDDASMTYTVTFRPVVITLTILLHSRSTVIECKCRGSWVDVMAVGVGAGVGKCRG